MTTSVRKLHEEWMKDPAYKAAYDALEPEFALAGELIKARAKAGLSQAEVASRMGTTQSVVARLEGGKTPPNFKTLEKYAAAVGRRVKVKLVPAA